MTYRAIAEQMIADGKGLRLVVYDISLGAYWRELTDAERWYADEVCGADSDMVRAMERLEMSE